MARRQILTYFDMIYPTGIRLDDIFKSVCYIDVTYSLLLFQKDIAYLRAKGYLEFIDEKIGGSSDYMQKVARLTAEGKEIAEQTQTDSALEI